MSPNGHSTQKLDRVSTGIPSLDQILFGGLVPGRSYLVRGGPGHGKTTLGLHFLTAAQAEPGLFISLGERADQLRADAEARGFNLKDVTFVDLSPTHESFVADENYDVFESAEVEGEPLRNAIKEAVEQHRPSRIFIDSVTQMRYLSPDAHQFRKSVIGALRFMAEQGATVLLCSEHGPEAPDDDVQYLVDGILHLSGSGSRRTIQVSKVRGSDFIAGTHDMRLGARGLEIFPRLIPEYHEREYALEQIGSGIPELDEMLHGGIERGTITVFTGPTGVGKTTVGLQFMKEAAGRGERSVVYSFEERIDTLVARCKAISIPIGSMIAQGSLVIEEIEPLRMTPDQFAAKVRDEVELRGARIVMLDSLSGYSLSLLGEDPVFHIHKLCRYLSNMGVTVLLPNEVESIAGGDFRATDVGISYLADTIVLLRYLEIGGELRKSIGILKKRSGDFQKTLRQFDISRYGLRVGEPLADMRGLLSGSPQRAA